MNAKKYRLMKKLLILSALFILGACQARVRNETAENQTGPSSDQLILSDDQIKLAGIISGKLEERTLSEELGCNGSIEIPPQSMISVSLPMEGFVKKIYFYSGSAVRKGDLLAVMEHPDFLALQKEYLVTGNNLVLLREDMERQEILAREDAASGKKLKTAMTGYENALVEHRAQEEQLRLLGIDPQDLNVQNMSSEVYVRSPITGYVKENYVNTGELLKAGQPIMDLEDVTHLHVHLVVYEKDIVRVKPEQQVLFVTGANEKEYRGRVHTVGRSIHEKSRSADVHVHLSNPDADLFAGMYVKARILVNARKVLAIPEEGIAGEEGRNYLFLRQGNSFTRMPVEAGIREHGYVEVRSPGLEDREIVLAGAYYLNAGMSGEK